ncbi:Hypothetical predicted protein [Cloeon dipterum]|uniref:PDZ domain-containing protein n=1 Tax=Cloeon dipterum TaxID=197152 RepID=A0A8S1C6D1_9INSE|nr:Hypothetical predicted protein [Cloeon dipterum]
MGMSEDEVPAPRLCHIQKWPDFDGFGFNLHAEKGRSGQYVGKVDDGSPSEAAGLKQGDRIIEVNGVNISNENHRQVVARIKAVADETRLLVVDSAAEAYFKTREMVIRGDMPGVIHLNSSKQEQQQQPTPPPPPQQHQEEQQQHKPAEQQEVVSNTSSATTPETDRKHHVEVQEEAEEEEESPSETTTIEAKSNGSIASSSPKMEDKIEKEPSQTASPNQSNRPPGLNMTAAELRAQLAQRKKFDPKKENMDLRRKFDIVQTLHIIFSRSVAAVEPQHPGSLAASRLDDFSSQESVPRKKMSLITASIGLLLVSSAACAQYRPSEAPRPIYVSPATSSEHPGALYLASLVNQLSTERYRIQGPTPVPETHPSSSYYENPGQSLMSHLQTWYNEAAESYLQRPPEAPSSKYPPSQGDSGQGVYYWHVPGQGGDESSTDMSQNDIDDMENVKGNDVAVTANPLFAAMAGFIGLSTLFAASVILFPKFGGSRSLQDHEDRDWGKQIVRSLQKMHQQQQKKENVKSAAKQC